MKSTRKLQPSDIVILVLGLTGAGKSTFINKAMGEDVLDVGHTLDSCTQDISCVPCLCPNDSSRHIIFVDTPGFDHSSGDDERILQHIAEWLARAYRAKTKIAGIVYLHEISLTRHGAYSKTALDIISRLCGEAGLKNVILATTKWNDLQVEAAAQKREKQLQVDWTRMLDHGSRMARFYGTTQSALDIVELILQKPPIDSLQIQQEMGRYRKGFSETEAAKTLRKYRLA
ncbi:P-loop containing nucleoside triphosphate hydrolase protein [Suillus paluster]|uniref:P-loop containing nucleoside triphosphate hydrolase protein n=1 Tax=Suillus paluster TaxID=48578 RepID=UPI001B864C2E|nr:P-loop containing nucleoside triphosphate hydrolase protein [Suillus paluster]KAG1740775.1 P-loop containing nucleoside triphosphate hydrolase protein [Suillus paluster]